MSQRFYCPEPPRDGCYRLPPDEARHLVRVCRKGVGDLVELFDGKGFATAARIVEADKDRTLLVAEGPSLPESSPLCSITLVAAIPKGDRLDWLVEKATELGVDRLIPIMTARSVVEPGTAKLERLRRAVIEASKQCGRNRLMVVEAIRPWAEVVADRSESAICLIALPRCGPTNRWPRLAGQNVQVAIGPEGGFTAAEEHEALALGWSPFQIGTFVLRMETAAMAAVVAILTMCREHEGDECH